MKKAIELLERWEAAFSGYAILVIPKRERHKYSGTSEGNMGNLIGETRALLDERKGGK